MVVFKDHIVKEHYPVQSVIPPLNRTLELSEKQTKFLLHAIRDVNPEAVDAEEEIKKRVLDSQKKAYETYPYPCVHALHHVALYLSECDAFEYIMKSGRSVGHADAPLVLDIGCCMGTDVRHLVQSGYPATSVIGCDLRQGFIDLGYELYADRDTCSISFIGADIFDITLLPFPQAAENACIPLKDVRGLNELRGRVKYIYAGLLFHLFDEGTQEAIARRLATLLNVSEGSGPAIIFGRHVAKERESVIEDAMGRTRYAHSPESWGKLWERVLGDTIPVRVDAEMRSYQKDMGRGAWNPGKGTEMLWWTVWIG